MKLLIVDDDRDLVELLTFALRRAGFEPIPAYDLGMARRLLDEQVPDLMVLDVNLGVENGLDLLREVRTTSRVPVVMLTARSAEDEKVRGLELGADDYLTKPFSHRELVARVRAVLRRYGHDAGAPPSAQSRVQVGPITLDMAHHEVLQNGEPVSVTVTEFRLLHYLMVNAGRVVTTGALLRQVWGYDDHGTSELVRVNVHRLRRKLETDPGAPRLLITVPGVGFVMRADEMSAEAGRPNR